MSRLFVASALAALATLTIPAPASPITNDKLAYLTFSGTVQVPGAMLSAGTYRFHLANPDTGRNVLQVLSRDGSIVYAMFHTIPDRRTTVTGTPTVTFRETPVGVPPAVRTLFYGGEYRGYEFVYGKGGPDRTPVIPPQPDIWYEDTPAGEPVFEPADVMPIPEPVLEQAPTPAPAPVELPRTASPLAVVTAGGIASLLAGFGTRWLRRRR